MIPSLLLDPSVMFHPVRLCKAMWPHDRFYDRQCDVLTGARLSTELYVAAGNELGKDWILGRLCVAFMAAPWAWYGPEHFARTEREGRGGPGAPEWVLHQRRCVTTSVKDEHLDVLWGEIGNAFRSCAADLRGRFVMTHHELRFRGEAEVTGTNVFSYLKGMISGSENMEALTGHHAPYTLACGDESSGLSDKTYEAFVTWAKRQVYIGNTKPCANFFKRNFNLGDLAVADAPVVVPAGRAA